jgi:hypothetical protein
MARAGRTPFQPSSFDQGETARCMFRARSSRAGTTALHNTEPALPAWVMSGTRILQVLVKWRDGSSSCLRIGRDYLSVRPAAQDALADKRAAPPRVQAAVG